MRRRHLIFATALVLALSVAVPTIGAPGNNVALKTAVQAKQIAKTAKNKALKAQNAARGAQTSAANAETVADAAATKADSASSAANAAGARLDGLQAESATAGATVTTGDETAFVDLGGPSVTVAVPESGLIEVWVQLTMADGLVSLYQDGNQVAGQDPNDACGPLSGSLLSVQGTPEATVATPGGFNIFGCGNTGPPAPLLLEATPGQHTFTLRYADCGCDPADAEFSDRTLTVAPRP